MDKLYPILTIDQMCDGFDDFLHSDRQVFYAGSIIGCELLKYISALAKTYSVTDRILIIEGCQDYICLMGGPAMYVYYEDLYDIKAIPDKEIDVFKKSWNPITYTTKAELDLRRVTGIRLIIIRHANLIPDDVLNDIKANTNCKIVIMFDPYEIDGERFAGYGTIVDSLTKQSPLIGYTRHIVGATNLGIDNRIRGGVDKVRLSKRSYGRIDNSQHICNDPEIVSEIKNKQISNTIRKNQKFLVTDDRHINGADNVINPTAITRNSLVTLISNNRISPKFVMHNSKFVYGMTVTYDQQHLFEKSDVTVTAGNILSIKEASYHRFKDITYIHNKNIPMSLREKYTLLKNSLNVKIVEMG
jgi:hypothetical protein